MKKIVCPYALFLLAVACSDSSQPAETASVPKCTLYHHPSVSFDPDETFGSQTSQASIVRSNITIPEDDPRRKSSVLVYYEDDVSTPTSSGRTICGGLVISNTATEAYVLTAAHCVQKSGRLVVATGERTTQLEEVVPVDEYAFHPGYTSSKEKNGAEGDIAWLKLKTPLQNASALPIWGNPSCLGKGTETYIVGYGKVDPSQQAVIPNTQKNAGVVEFLSYHTEETVKHTLLFESATGTGACFGDSGAGATISYAGLYVGVGITHGVHKKLIPQLDVDNVCETGRSVYTAIGPYVDWLMSTSGVQLNEMVLEH